MNFRANFNGKNIPLHERLALLDDFYEVIESFGFAEQFRSPYRQYMRYNGMKFNVDRRVTPDEVPANELDKLPMWHITLQNGEKIQAVPEEIAVLYQETDEPGPEPEPLEAEAEDAEAEDDENAVTDVKVCDHLMTMRTISFKIDDIQLFADFVFDSEKEEYSVWFYEAEANTKYFMYGVPVHQHLITGDHNITFNEFYEDVLVRLEETACCFLGAYLDGE